MLKLECPECKQWIHSPFLVDYKEMQCPSCSARVQVSELYISAGPFSIHREVLRKHMFKYKRLLMEAEKELDDLKAAANTFKADPISTKSIGLFINNLKEMLSGCRESTRFAPEGLDIRFVAGQKAIDARLVNISTTGVCVDIGKQAAGIKKGDEVSVELKGVGSGRLPGIVIWAGNGQVGVRFGELSEEIRKNLFEFLRDNAQVVL
ncbi:MAG: PilZ domain-containing protein [Deltaproteobacteria bacterium]|nr:PilZ domain-containing protein [Deltaproteobacteria bacterium]